jgi:hypothetical protein
MRHLVRDALAPFAGGGELCALTPAELEKVRQLKARRKETRDEQRDPWPGHK